MTIELSKVTFVNDFVYINCDNGAILVLNKLEESIAEDSRSLDIRNINIAYLDIDNNYTDCNMAIGLSNAFMRLYSDYKELEGKVLTVDNMSLCKIEVFDE